MPERVCKKCGAEKAPKIEVLDGVAVYTFPKKCSACRRARYLANREKEIERAKAWQKANPDRFLPYNRRKVRTWKRENPEKAERNIRLRLQRLKNAPGGPYEPTRYIGRVEMYDSRCYYCETALATTLDHVIPVSRGGSNFPANIVPACLACNVEKGAKKFRSEWLPERLRDKNATANKR